MARTVAADSAVMKRRGDVVVYEQPELADASDVMIRRSDVVVLISAREVACSGL